MADTGLPGNPITGLPPHRPTMAGLPGRSASPCTRGPGSPSSATMSTVRSRALTELPAESTSMSD